MKKLPKKEIEYKVTYFEKSSGAFRILSYYKTLRTAEKNAISATNWANDVRIEIKQYPMLWEELKRVSV